MLCSLCIQNVRRNCPVCGTPGSPSHQLALTSASSVAQHMPARLSECMFDLCAWDLALPSMLVARKFYCTRFAMLSNLSYSGAYSWKEQERARLDAAFYVEPFTMASMGWEMSVYPLGSSDQGADSADSSFDVWLKLISSMHAGPVLIASMRLECIESASSFQSIRRMEVGDFFGWPARTMSQREVRNHDWKQLTFSVTIDILRVMSRDGAIIYQHPRTARAAH